MTNCGNKRLTEVIYMKRLITCPKTNILPRIKIFQVLKKHTHRELKIIGGSAVLVNNGLVSYTTHICREDGTEIPVDIVTAGRLYCPPIDRIIRKAKAIKKALERMKTVKEIRETLHDIN